MNILVTGANGQLGTEMRNVSSGGDDRYIFTDVSSPKGVDTVYLDIEIIIDHISAGGNQHGCQHNKNQHVPGHLFAEGGLVQNGHYYPFLHQPYESREKQQIAPPD